MGTTETGHKTKAACKTKAGCKTKAAYKREYRRLPAEGQLEDLAIRAPTGLPRDDPRGTLLLEGLEEKLTLHRLRLFYELGNSLSCHQTALSARWPI